MKENKVIFIAEQEATGFSARAESLPIFTQGEDYEDLKANIEEALALHFEDEKSKIPLSFTIITECLLVSNG